MLKLKVLIIVLASFPLICFSQSSEPSHTEIIYRLSEFRTAVLTKDESALSNLKLLLDRFENEDIENETFRRIVSSCYLGKSYYNSTNERILEDIGKINKKNDTNYYFSENELDAILNNFEVLNLIFIGVLRKDYPFALEKDLRLLEEYTFYDIHQNEQIGEVGAGGGTFSLLTGLLFTDVKLYVNDKMPLFINFTQKYFDGYSEYIDSNRLKLVKGKKRSTKFEVNSLDKIIIRNSFHHFKKKKKMLNSIKNSLKQGGELYLYEPFNGLTDHDEGCKKIMLQEDCLQVIQENGFKLEESKQLDTRMLLRFSVVE